MKTILTITAIMLATTAHADKPNDNGPCTTGNAIFCGVQGEPGPAGPQGPQGETGPQGEAGVDGADGQDGATGAQGPAGADGRDGIDGADGRDGADFDASGHAASLASASAIGSLQMYDPLADQTTWGIGLGGQFDGEAGFAAGARYGITDDLSGYLTIGTSGGSASYGVGLAGRF